METFGVSYSHTAQIDYFRHVGDVILLELLFEIEHDLSDRDPLEVLQVEDDQRVPVTAWVFLVLGHDVLQPVLRCHLGGDLVVEAQFSEHELQADPVDGVFGDE